MAPTAPPAEGPRRGFDPSSTEHGGHSVKAAGSLRPDGSPLHAPGPGSPRGQQWGLGDGPLSHGLGYYQLPHQMRGGQPWNWPILGDSKNCPKERFRAQGSPVPASVFLKEGVYGTAAFCYNAAER